MFLTHEGACGTMTGDTADDSLVLTTTAEIAAGEVAVLRLSMTTATILATADSDHVVSVTDSAGNTWTKIGERTRAGANPSTFEKATIVALWFSHLTATLPSGGTITANLDAQYRAYCMGANAYSVEIPGSVVAVAGVGTASGKSNPTSMAVTCTPAAGIDDYTWLLAVATNANPGDALTLSGLYTTDLTKFGSQPDFFRRTVLAGQYRQLNNDTQTWTGSVTGADVLWAAVLGALTVTFTPPPAPEGTREYQGDFETVSHTADDTSTELRPDGVVPDYRIAASMGPANIGDTSGGIHTHTWQVRADASTVWLRRETDNRAAWEDEEVFFTYTGVPIDEISLAFTEDGYPVMALQRNTQIGGGPTVSVRYWNGSVYTENILGAGRSPRVVSDYFPAQVGGTNVCPPSIEVQLFWLKDGQGMKRRSSGDNYGTDYATVLAHSAYNRLHQAVRTEDRRISVMYSQRNLATGRYQFRRVDSKTFPDSALRRPLFINSNVTGFDLYTTGEEMWYRDGDPVNTWYLRVQTQDAADEIEVAAAPDYPSGLLPPFNLQVQTASVVNAGDFQTFAFTINHGAGYSDLMAFRARVKRTVGGNTCYSPWRYLVLPTAYPLTGAVGDFLTTCDRDAMIDVPERLIFLRGGAVETTRLTSESARYDYGVCSSSPVLTEASTFSAPYFRWMFVGGVRNTTPSFPFPTHLQPYALRRRAMISLDFTDEDRRHRGYIVGRVLQSWAGDPGYPDYLWPADRFPLQFPDDTGNFSALVSYPDDPNDNPQVVF
jgi:hypothetical protein